MRAAGVFPRAADNCATEAGVFERAVTAARR